MADGTKQTNGNGATNRQEIKDLIKSGKAFSFIRDEITKTYETPEGDFYVEVIASSDQEDLVGDVMTSKALQVMKTSFIGKTVFMNHRTNVPDDVFGSIVSADIQKSDGVQLLVLNIVVEKENEAAMKTWRMIAGGRTKLGTSVTVLIKSSKPNPNRRGGIIIDDVETIEHSIVGVPCNRESLTMTATATKALSLGHFSDEEEDISMGIEKSAAAGEATAEASSEVIAETAAVETEVAETPAEEAPAETVEAEAEVVAEDPPAETADEPAAEAKSLFPRTAAAIAKFKALVADVTASKVAKTAAELPALTAKGMFADQVEHPKMWDLIDILFDCYYTLCSQVWNKEWVGDTDFTEIEASWAECLTEFAASAADSFNFWKIPASDVDAVSMSLEEAQKMHDSFTQIGDLIANMPDKADEMRTIGKSLLEIAAKAGVPFTAPIEANVTVDVTKTKEFQDVATRAETAEAALEEVKKELAETQDDLEVTKAGLAVAVEATNAHLRKPLHEAGTN